MFYALWHAFIIFAFPFLVTSILIFVLFYVRRRRRRVRIEHDTAVSATLAAAGFTRRALDDDIDDGPPGSTGTRYRDSDPDPFGTNRSVNHSAGSGGALEMEYGYAVPMAPSAPAGQPSPSYNPPGSGPGYIPVPTAEHGNPVPGHSPGPSIGGGANLGEKGHGHNASAGSYEPLLGAFWASQGLLNEDAIKDEPPTAGSSRDGTVPTPPPRNPRRLIDSPSGTPSPLASSAGHPNKPNEDLLGLGAPQKETKKVFDDTSSVYSHNTVGDQLQANRITKARVKAGREGLEDASIFGDHEDYSKRVGGGGVLGVRNATDLDRARSVRSSLES
ncbi:hypothetical protein BDP27DRAFT_1398481 [Rhodocollybia butyracea]|uniref:Uncharacterized protein n=1 Tax=Rhodocollybia butyracea TaxID=206335 RepID=A0A9P5Q180_9AGAR|nr:hypothetical protein BDP27DRAFT_1398481 [Rhodocollybia butyracea]